MIKYYRPVSKTESCIDIKREYLLNDYPRKQVNAEIQTEYDYYELFINKLMLFFLHLFLISIFELVFFFNYVTKFENNAINGIFNGITSSIINSCSNLEDSNKTLINAIFRNFINTTLVNQNAINSYNSRMLVNDKLFSNGITYFLMVLAINFLLIFTNICIIKRKINYNEIIIDNLIMITLLGMYEYIFFSNIVFKYLTISNDEILLNFQNNFLNNC
jgi:hypothetical protein